MRLYKWGYSWEEILALYKVKVAEYVDRRSQDYEFLVKLAKAALGGKDDNQVGLDTGDGLEERDASQDEALKAMLGDDYDRVVNGA